jgi:hypothetical protein
VQGNWGTQGRSTSKQDRSQRRGPKGYTRSDDRIKEDICEQLMQSAHIDASEITIEVQSGRVMLEGSVPERRMKHAIEDLADSVAGVNDVENKIRVNQGSSSQDSQRSGSDWQSRGSSSSSGAQGPGGTSGSSSSFGSNAGSSSSETSNSNTASRGSGSSQSLAGQSTSSSSTAKSAS